MRSKILSNSFWLSVVHFSGYVIPLLEVPILARALGAESYGKVILALSFALVMSVFVEFGFNISASRDISRSARGVFKQIVGEVLLSKVVISVLVVSVSVPMALWFGLDSQLFIPAFIYFLAFAFSPFWFFQGTENVVVPSLLSLGGRLIGLLLIFLCVSDASDYVLALSLLALAGFTNTAITLVWAIILAGGIEVTIKGAWERTKQGWHAFMYRGAGDIMGSVSPLILGSTAGSQSVGHFVPAEKVIRAASGLQQPILIACFPYFSRSGLNSIRRAWYLVLFVFVLSTLLSVFMWCAAPYIVRLMLGDGFDKTVDLIRMLSFTIPFRMLNQSIAMTILLPNKQDTFVGYSALLAVIFTCLLGYFLSTLYGATGMALAIIFTDLILSIILISWSLQWRRS